MDDTGRTMALVNGLRLMEPNQVVIVPKDSFGELFLPIKSNIGDEIDIHGKGRFIIKQHVGQQILVYDRKTSRGKKGSITALEDDVSLRLYCRIKDKSWGVSVCVTKLNGIEVK